MRILTPLELADLKRQRAATSTQAIRPSYARGDEASIIRYAFVKPWSKMTAEEQVNALGAISADLRALADQVDEERLAIAEKELSA